MGIKGATLGMALAASMGACETTEDNQKETQYGQSTQALNIHDPEHFGQPFTPDRILAGDHDRNRSVVMVDGQPQEFEFFIRDQRVFVQRCDQSPEECTDPIEIPVVDFTGQINSALSVSTANPDGTFSNRIYLASIGGSVQSNPLLIDQNGMPTANPDDIDGWREEAGMVGGASLAPATMEINGQMVEGIIWAGLNNELNFHNPVTGENTLLAENFRGLGVCGVSSRGLEYDFRANDRNVNGCRIFIRAEAAIATGLVGSDARDVTIGQLDGSVRRFIYFTDVDGTSKSVEILPYDGDGVCAPGDVLDCAVVAPDMGVPPADAAVQPEDMNVSPPDMGVDAEVVDAAVIAADANVSPDLGADAAIPPDGGVVGDAMAPDAGLTPDAATPDAALTPDGSTAQEDCKTAPDNFTIKKGNDDKGKPNSNADCIEVCTDENGSVLVDKVRITGTGQCTAEVRLPGSNEPATVIIRGLDDDMQPIPDKPLDITFEMKGDHFSGPEVVDVAVRYAKHGHKMDTVDAEGNVSGASGSIVETIARTRGVVDLINDNDKDKRLVDEFCDQPTAEDPDCDEKLPPLVYTFANGQAAISVGAGERVRVTKSTGEAFPIGTIPQRPDAGVKEDAGVPTPPTMPPTAPATEPSKHKKKSGGCSVVLGMSDGSTTEFPGAALSLIVAAMLTRVRRRKTQTA